VNDNIKTYVMSAAAGVKKFCPSCDRQRAVWVGETEGGETLTCCSVCQRVIMRRETAAIPPLSVTRNSTPNGPSSPTGDTPS